MKNENRAVFDRASERSDFVLDLPGDAGESHTPRNAKGRGLGRLISLIAGKLRAYRNRVALLELTDDQLKDIGVSRSQAYGDYSRYRQSASHSLERTCR